tara:strand:+ start:812 stop:1144 length:333 start_codon:yes stop_codon:yes gene_type:complete
MKTLGTRVNDSFADAIAFFARSKEQTTAYFIREATREAASNIFRQKCELREEKQRFKTMAHQTLSTGIFDGEELEREWVKQIEQYEVDLPDLIREIEEMRPFFEVLRKKK